MLGQALKPGGKLFFIDSLPKPSSTARDMATELEAHASRTQASDDDARLKRRLNDGHEYQIVKVYYVPEKLSATFKTHNLAVEVKQTDNFFLYGWGTLQK